MLFLFSSCNNKINVNKLIYNEKAGFYTYKNYPVRFSDSRLIHRYEIDSFLLVLSSKNFKYPIYNFIEDDKYITREDHYLTQKYCELNQLLTEKKYFESLATIYHLYAVYPQLYKYSDIDYLMAYAFMGLNKTDSVRYHLRRFILYGGQKYSFKFRQNNNDTCINNIFYNERKSAYQALNDSNTLFFIPVCPEKKFFYESLSYGYLINPSNVYKKTSLSINVKDNFSVFGLSAVYQLNQNNNVIGIASIGKNNRHFTIGVAHQLYKSTTNRLGLKYGVGIHFNQGYQNYFNPFMSISLGFHINHRFYLGARYIYSFKDKVISEIEPQGWDLNLCMQLLKALSLTTGLNNGKPVVGITSNGIFVGYNWYYKSFLIVFNGL